MGRTIATALAAVAVVVALGAAYWVSKHPPPPPTSASSSSTSEAGSSAKGPLEVFAQATVGDWHAFKSTHDGSFGKIQGTAIAKVMAVSEQEVKVQVHGRVNDTNEERTHYRTYPRRSITLGQLVGTDHVGWKVFDVAMKEEDHTVGGRTFHCTKVTYQHDDPLFPAKKSRVELWISKDVPAGGLVEEREVQELDDLRFELSRQLIGFGRGDAATWGGSAAGYERSTEAADGSAAAGSAAAGSGSAAAGSRGSAGAGGSGSAGSGGSAAAGSARSGGSGP